MSPSIWNETCVHLHGLSDRPFPYKRSIQWFLEFPAPQSGYAALFTRVRDETPRRQARRARGAMRKAYVKQYVDRPNGEPARRQACRSGVLAVAVEAFVNYAG